MLTCRRGVTFLCRRRNGSWNTSVTRSLSGSSGSEEVSERRSWGRMTLKVAEELDTEGSASKYIEKAKERVEADPVKSLLRIQDEVQAEMAAALGRTGDRVEFAIREVKDKQRVFESLAAEFQENKSRSLQDQSICRALLQSAREYNAALQVAEARRLDLIIHRQAIGFVFKNVEYVRKAFPLPKLVTKREFSESFFDIDEFETRGP